jgi:hypothetical protein
VTVRKNRDAILGELGSLFGRLTIAERDYDSGDPEFSDGAIGKQVADAIEHIATRDAAAIGLPMAFYSVSLANLAITTRGQTKKRASWQRKVSEHITAITNLVTTGRARS